MRRTVLFLSAMALVCGCGLGTEILACLSTPFPPAPVPCSTTPSVSCLFKNLLNTAVGSAALALDPNNSTILHVTGIGSTGADGYQILTGGSIAVDTNVAWDIIACDANDTPTGAFMDVSSVGAINGEPGKPLGSIRLTDIGSALEISADFTPQGSTTQMIQVFKDGQLVTSISGHTGIVGTVFPWPTGVAKIAHTNPSAPGCYRPHFPKGTTFSIAGGPTVVGDEIAILSESGAIVNSISSVQTRLKDIPGIRVTSETINMTPGIPTLSQWGLIALTTLLLIIGATLILRRAREGAA